MRKRRRWRREAAGVAPGKAPSGPPSAERLAWTLGRAGCKTRQSEDTQAAQVEHRQWNDFLYCATSPGI